MSSAHDLPESLMLIGRSRELRALSERIDAVHHRGGALVLRGEAGVGKSSLLAAAKRHAGDQGLHILATSGVPSESHLPFAALHHLLQPLLGEAEGLPPAQRDAVRAAFALGEDHAPAPFLLALALLHLLCEVAARAPIVVAVDDAQWLDPPSADVLAFIARRLESDPVLMFLGIRVGLVQLARGAAALGSRPLAGRRTRAREERRAPAGLPALTRLPAAADAIRRFFPRIGRCGATMGEERGWPRL